MFECLRIWSYRDLIIHKAWGDFRAESLRSYLGVGWWVLDPIINTAIYYLVFGVFFKRGGEDYIPFLTIGIITWMWFFKSVTASSRSILSNVGFVRVVSFNKIVFPCSQIAMCTYQFVFSLLVLFAVLLLYDVEPSSSWLFLPLILIVELLFITACGLIIGAIVPFVPDLANLTSYFLRLVFFLSGVMYAVSELSPRIQNIMMFNPMVHIIDAYRDILMYNRIPNWNILGLLVTISILGIYAGAYLIWRCDKIYAKWIIS